MRSPYRTFFKNFIGFQRLYVGTIEGQVAIQNRTPPVIYLLPSGEIKVMNLIKSKIYRKIFYLFFDNELKLKIIRRRKLL